MSFARQIGAAAAAIVVGNAVAAAQAADVPECRPRAGLPHFVAKARAGQPVTVAYLGGSITDMDGWRGLSGKWLQARYPSAKVTGFNDAVPGTGSDLGVFRLNHDVLAQKPDLVFVEFAVNDTGQPADRIERAMEGIVRKVWRALPDTDICFVYTVMARQTADYREGKLPPSAQAMEAVAGHYGIPSIAFGVSVARLEGEGKLVFTGKRPASPDPGHIVFSPDGTHPYSDIGHALYRDAVARSFPAIETAGTAAGPHSLPAPLLPDNWESARAVSPGDVTHTGDWKRIDAVSDERFRQYARSLPSLWVGTAGASLTIPFSGSVFGLCGQKGPDTGQFSVSIDGAKPVTATFFDSFSTPGHWRIKPWWYPAPLSPGTHTAVVTVLPEPPDKAKILGKPLASFGDPTVFAPNNVYLSGILVVPDEKR